MKKFHYIKYQKEYDSYFFLFEQDKEAQKFVSFVKENSYLIFMEDQFIGLFSLYPFYPKRIEIYRWIIPKLRNQGLGTKVVEDISNFAFSIFPERTEIISNIHYQNKGAQRSIQKAGFMLDQEAYLKRQENGEGNYFIPYVKKKMI